jgi:hypothetical protein
VRQVASHAHGMLSTAAKATFGTARLAGSA